MSRADACRAFLAPARPEWRAACEVAPGRALAHLRHPEGTDLIARSQLGQEIDLYERPGARPPLFVSYYTADTPYAALAARLARSLDRLGLAHRIEAIPSRGSWVANTGLKAGFIARAWTESDRPICWIDADAELLRLPHVVFDNPFDIALVRRHGWYDISSFVYLGKTEAAGALVQRWAEFCAAHPQVWDQVLLTLAWQHVAQRQDMASLWLHDGIFRFPRPWLRDLRDRLLYYPSRRKIRPFVDQKQASRQLKSVIDGAARRPGERGSDDLSPAFRAMLAAHRFDIDPEVAMALWPAT